jgi:hypothetical protein
MSRGLFPERDLTRALAEETFGPSKPSPAPGSAKIEDPVLANPGACWCGKDKQHTWPGMEDGVPHPRE